MNRSQIYANVTHEHIVASMMPCLNNCILCCHRTAEEMLQDWCNVLRHCINILRQTSGSLGVPCAVCVDAVICMAREKGWYTQHKWQALAGFLLAAEFEIAAHKARTGVPTPFSNPARGIVPLVTVPIRMVQDALHQNKWRSDTQGRGMYEPGVWDQSTVRDRPDMWEQPSVREQPMMRGQPSVRKQPSESHTSDTGKAKETMRDILTRLHILDDIHESVQDTRRKVSRMHKDWDAPV
jgi:hypothetical protein